MKNILVIYYSQSGQLESIARNIAKPLLNSDEVNVVFHEIQLEKPFPFPWNKDAFFDAFPESFLQIPTALKPVPTEILNTKFDLILLHYQVWYLSPSIPINSFLKSSEAKTLFNNTPVVTISGSRNMWVMAQEKIKVLLKSNNAQLKGNIALVDRVGNLISVITIVEWMFSGVKKKYLGIFPLPGVSEKDIVESSKFGEIIFKNLQNNNFDNLQAQLLESKAVKISSYLVKVDKTANKIFNKWSNIINNKKQSRKIWLKIFNIYLWLAIWLISPIVYILHLFLYPFYIKKIRREKAYYQGV
ncbi:dialkylresorcinol condensing enzyme DarA [Flavobacterium psychrophilum]|uniref:dialkylrecorsinol condensing enzyme DarA n=1 Tax=Flavobacterium psychrophilum TaxID=96345 RepID=UPI00061875E4|nr:dialkylrecorsinol condensing enzyme DarA [Flavobacterium psychrophilum]EKT3963805.1 dialkylresorcinol condensing enzyme DarA [Flavobacterium psychrophilum]EKT3966604.1 dialkylresorcinol condensing enzyme DarA [Flavobacterium psychrophilum]EKT4509311.1 dialkylresorcinol condensing enzyme DarA [Flavobacterium psychrophilum]EKT4517274.1 dialkylresorcinol condensing enzyme DarA [Flavobacterium psychrophilum]EKT4549686.1 dialkylresorcinol condensing enzyme DarA [Flavobacterium psychrophilum]